MTRRKWFFGLSLFLAISVVLGIRLFGQTRTASAAAPVDRSEECQIEEPRQMTAAERRYLRNQPRHWREMMIRR